MKPFTALVLLLCLGACNKDEENLNTVNQSNFTLDLNSNTTWPLEVKGNIDIYDVGVGDSEYGEYALAIMQVDGQSDAITLEFSSSILINNNMMLDFQFGDSASILIGAPSTNLGELSYPVIAVNTF